MMMEYKVLSCYGNQELERQMNILGEEGYTIAKADFSSGYWRIIMERPKGGIG